MFSNVSPLMGFRFFVVCIELVIFHRYAVHSNEPRSGEMFIAIEWQNIMSSIGAECDTIYSQSNR